LPVIAVAAGGGVAGAVVGAASVLGAAPDAALVGAGAGALAAVGTVAATDVEAVSSSSPHEVRASTSAAAPSVAS
jgi:hypothetical protein